MSWIGNSKNLLSKTKSSSPKKVQNSHAEVQKKIMFIAQFKLQTRQNMHIMSYA